MLEPCVVVADAARARIYRLVPAAGAQGAPTGRLEELVDLVNPGRRQRPSEIFSETRPGSRQATPGGPGHAVDDRRDSHQDAEDLAFAREIIAAAAAVVHERKLGRTILVAPPRMLGFLRQVEAPLRRLVEVEELAREMTRLSPSDLYARLVERELLSVPEPTA